MKVRIPDQSDKIVTGEMLKVDESEIGQIVGEMITEPTKLKDLGFSDAIVAKATGMKEATGDEHPEFAVVRVEEGWSGSRRLWPAKELDRIVDQTNTLEPVGHLGHIPDEEMATSFGDPQTTWLGAYAKTEASTLKERVGEMVRVAYFAGYNHPGAKIRQHIRTKTVRGVSWWGRATHIPIPGKGVEMRDFDLLAIDWARKLAEGMPSSSIVAITGEMEGNKMDKELSAVTPDEFKAANPNGYALLRKEVEDEHKTTIGEMETKVTEGEGAKTLLTKACELLGIDKPEELSDKITELKSKIGDRAKATLKTSLDAVLLEKVPGDDDDAKHKREVLGRLLPVGEMQTKLSNVSDDEDAKKVVGEMVDAAFDSDTTIKTLIGEQQAPSVRRREELNRGEGGGLDNNRYAQNRERVTVS